MNSYQLQIWGELTDDAHWELDLGDPPPDTEWYEVPLPRCPDCGGDLVWDEANDGPGSLEVCRQADRLMRRPADLLHRRRLRIGVRRGRKTRPGDAAAEAIPFNLGSLPAWTPTKVLPIDVHQATGIGRTTRKGRIWHSWL